MALCKTRMVFGKRTSLLVMFAMTAILFLAEISVGYLTHSNALIADSFHMLSDVISLVIGYLAIVVSKMESKHNTYGWARAEVLGALVNAVFLFALCFTIIVSAIKRIIEVEEITQPLLVVYVGSAGLGINLIGLFLFHGHTHGHHHDHDHDNDQNDSLVESNKDNNENNAVKNHGAHLNMKGVFLHVLGDALGSIVVLVSALIINFAEGHWKNYIDPVMSLVIATLIICTTWPLLKRSSLILLQNPPGHIDKDDLLNELIKIHGIQAIHEFHIWQLSGNITIASAHVTMHKSDDFNETALEVNKLFHDRGVHSLTLQPEFYDCHAGQSVCGADNCEFLTGSSTDLESEAFIEREVSKPTQSLQQNLNISPCLLPCVSTKCKKFQCCSQDGDENDENKKKADTDNHGLKNPCYIEMNSDIQKYESRNEFDTNKINKSVEPCREKLTLPRCSNRHNSSSIV